MTNGCYFLMISMPPTYLMFNITKHFLPAMINLLPVYDKIKYISNLYFLS